MRLRSNCLLLLALNFLQYARSFSFNFQGILDWTSSELCRVEFCKDFHIKLDSSGLNRDLKEYVFGQPFASDVIAALRAHFNSDYEPNKALTLSFHGWPGGGKNYVASFIESNIYKCKNSKFVHHFIGRIHFPLEAKVDEYKANLLSWLKGNITKCSRQLFIFDEVDKMPSGVLNVIKPMIDYKSNVDGEDYRKSIFIFLSNTGANEINSKYLELWHNGMKREDLKLTHFEKVISKGAFNEKGGFHLSDTIKHNLINHYIPFLPLERHHVMQCIKQEFKIRKVDNPQEQHVLEVLEELEWGPYSEQIFSLTGCKGLSSKVALLTMKYYFKHEEL